MFISQKHISRRTVLRGMGVTVALPLLEAMVPAGAARARRRAGKVRLAAIEMVHGSAGATAIGAKKFLWSPEATGSAFDLSPSSLAPLEPFRDYLTIISNTDVRNAEAFTPPEIGGDHFRSSAVFLTQAHPKQTQGSDVHVGDVARSDVRAEVRPGHADSVDAAVHRERRSGRRLRLRLRLRLHGHGQLGRRRPSRCRWCATRAPRSIMLFGVGATPEQRAARRRGRQEHPRLDHDGGGAAEGQPRPGGPRPPDRLPRRRARDRAPHPAHRGRATPAASRASCRWRRWACPTRSKSTSS